MAQPTLFLADTSAWHRSTHPVVAAEWRRLLQDDRIATTELVRLEVLYSARGRADYQAVSAELDGLHQLAAGTGDLRRALEVQGMLAQKPLHHRVAIPDLVIAAVAERHGAAVWHYDQDYERIAAITGQPEVWVAARGTI
ncbi:MAG: PIN domain nuclease [Candidatus Dormibacteria bacterium]